MKICIPVTEDRGLDSPVCEHFGSTPFFLFVDDATGVHKTVPNGNTHHEHGGCHPMRALASEEVDRIVVGGIGRGALLQLMNAGVGVFQARPGTAKECLDAMKQGMLAEVDPGASCGGHGAGHQHHHRHA